MDQVLGEMFSFAFAHFDQIGQSAVRNARSIAGHASSASSACSGERITPGACRIVLIVISPGAFNSFCNARIAS